MTNKTYYFIDKDENAIFTFATDSKIVVVKERGNAVLCLVENDETAIGELAREHRGKFVVAFRSAPTTTRFGTSISVEVVSSFDSKPLAKIFKKESATFGATRKWKLSVRDESVVDYLLDEIFNVYAKEIGVSLEEESRSIFFG